MHAVKRKRRARDVDAKKLTREIDENGRATIGNLSRDKRIPRGILFELESLSRPLLPTQLFLPSDARYYPFVAVEIVLKDFQFAFDESSPYRR